MDRTLAEDLLLLALDDVDGASAAPAIDRGLAGALLVELAELGAVQWHDGRVSALPDEPVPHPVLARARDAIAGARRTHPVEVWVAQLPVALRPITQAVAQPLVEQGALLQREHRVVGLFPSLRFPAADAGAKEQLYSRLREVLLHHRPPTARDVTLLGLLQPLGLVDRLVARDERAAARARAEELTAEPSRTSDVTGHVQDTRAVTLTLVLAAVGAAVVLGGATST